MYTLLTILIDKIVKINKDRLLRLLIICYTSQNKMPFQKL